MTCCEANTTIDSCAPYANVHSTRAALDRLMSCCTGTITAGEVDPITDPDGAILKAFPNGLNGCSCPVIWIRSTAGGLWGSWDGGASFDFMGTNNTNDLCCKGLTLAAGSVNPVTQPATAYAMAFPDGQLPGCDCPALMIPFSNGLQYVSYSGGTRWIMNSKPPMIVATAASGGSFTGGGLTHNVTFSTVLSSRGGITLDSSLDFILPLAGEYMINFTLQTNGSAANGGDMYPILEHRRNNVVLDTIRGTASFAASALGGAGHFYLAYLLLDAQANDALRFRFYNNDVLVSGQGRHASIEYLR